MNLTMNRTTKRIVITAAVASAAMLSAAQAQTLGTATTDLNVRSGPDPQFPVIGMIRENRRATVLGCIDGSRWCQVDRRGRTGWVYSQYMTLSGDVVAVLPAPEIEVDVAARPVVAAPAPVVAYMEPAPAVAYRAPVYAAPAPVVGYDRPAAAIGYNPPPPIVTYQAAPAVTYQEPVVAYRTAPAATYQTPAPVVAYRAPVTTLAGTTGVAPRDFAGRLLPPRETIYASSTLPRAYVPPRAVRNYVTTNPLETVWLEGSLMVGAGIPDEIETMPVPGSRYDYAYVNDYAVLIDPGTRRIVYVLR
ncbi:MAG: DUF1236 domain-containing protein [Pseudorhodoplanes sp.]